MTLMGNSDWVFDQRVLAGIGASGLVSDMVMMQLKRRGLCLEEGAIVRYGMRRWSCGWLCHCLARESCVLQRCKPDLWDSATPKGGILRENPQRMSEDVCRVSTYNQRLCKNSDLSTGVSSTT